MKLETFFEKFDQFADAPDAVQKIRELILNFAVTGRLSEQRAGDAPVSELIDALSAAKARRGKTGRRGSAAAVPPESIIDRPIDAPSHWAWVPLNEIGAMSGGMTPSKDKSAFWDGSVNWFSSKDIKTDELTESELKITRQATEATGLQVYSPGCLVMVARSGILKRTFPVSILRAEGTVNQDLKVLSPFVGGIERYLQIMLRGMTGFILTSLVKTGTTVQSLKYEEFEAQPFPLPPLAEQKRIVAKVDELMALCDRLEAQQQVREERASKLARASLARFADAPTPDNLQFLFHPSYEISPADLRKSILTLAVQGKLVPQDPNDEPAEKLFERIQAERAKQEAKGAYKSSRPLEPIEESEEPFKLPVEWKWARLRSLVFTLGDGLHGTPEYSDGTDCYFINGNNLVDGRIVIKPHTKTVSLDEAKKHRKPMTSSSVLVSINGTLGSVAFYDNENVILGKSACYFNLASLVDKHFVRRVIESPYFVNYASKNATGTTIRNLGLKAMNYFPFPLPPLAEQRRIVAKVEQLMALVDALEQQLTTSRATAEKLLNAVVHELTSSHSKAST